jgi:succinyl-diaminopimelate desuccinylase
MQHILESTLAKLVSIPSISADTTACHEALAYVQSELEPLGLFIHSEIKTSHPWLLATTRKTKTPDILLVTHLDVVPAPVSLFAMDKREGKLYGRGVFDMKLAAACYIELLKAHSHELVDINIGVLFTTDEEAGGDSMIDILGSDLRPRVAFIPDGGDNWHIEKRAKGLYNIELIAHGQAAHGSRPWEGKNALHMLFDALQDLRSRYPSDDQSGATLGINLVSAGTAINQLPDHASAFIDFRSFSKKELAEYQELVDQVAEDHSLEVRIISFGNPLLFDEAHPDVQSFLAAFREHTGKNEIDYMESYGGSDARYFAEYEIPCIVVEPNGGSRHGDEEWLLASDLEKFYHLIETWVFSTHQR